MLHAGRSNTMQNYTKKKDNGNNFIDKFYLLNSQETSEEISWSCSDSSEYEDNIPCGKFINISKSYSRKRKRGNNKRKELRNISNLNITIVDTGHERKPYLVNVKSPILVAKLRPETLNKSPTFTPTHSRFMINKPVSVSPVTHKPCDLSKEVKNILKSPIIQLKKGSPKVSPKVKKKLFETAQSSRNSVGNIFVSSKSISPIIGNNADSLDRRKCAVEKMTSFVENNVNFSQLSRSLGVMEQDKNLNKEHRNINLKDESTNPIYEEISIQSTSSSDDNVANVNNSHTELVAKVKSYFDNYFSTQTSQQSISECETPTPKSISKSSDEMEINQITQVKSLTPSLKEAQTTTSFGSYINSEKSKKVKYKKGGLAYRLNALLRKQNASISLWQHERFMAENSNFIIPKEEFLAFRIKNIDFSYSIYLLEVVNKDDKQFLVVINSLYVNDNSFEIDNLLKIYKPYNFIESNINCNIIVNVCKFECGKLKF